MEKHISIYVLIAVIATTPTTGRPLVSVLPPMTIYTLSPNGRPPEVKESNPLSKRNPGTWATTLDYPALALREERERTTTLKLNINKEGRVFDCVISKPLSMLTEIRIPSTLS